MRLREYLELQAKDNKTLHEWSEAAIYISNSGDIITPYNYIPSTLPNGLKPYEIYHAWNKSNNQDEWTVDAFDEIIIKKHFKHVENIFTSANNYSAKKYHIDINSVYTINDIMYYYGIVFEKMIREDIEKVFIAQYSDDKPIYCFFWDPTIENIACFYLTDYTEDPIEDMNYNDFLRQVEYALAEYLEQMATSDPDKITLTMAADILNNYWE